jgi:hypothetical protein
MNAKQWERVETLTWLYVGLGLFSMLPLSGLALWPHIGAIPAVAVVAFVVAPALFFWGDSMVDRSVARQAARNQRERGRSCPR